MIVKEQAFLLLLVVGAGAGIAQAQPRMFERRSPPDIQAFEAQRAADLALLIDLKPAQKAAFDAFIASRRHDRRGEADDAGGPPPSASGPRSFPERLDAMEKRLTESSARQRARIVAARQFYDRLDAAQKQRFDALDRLRPSPWGGSGRIVHRRRTIAEAGDAPPGAPEPGAPD